jgi:hypothetical protein
VRAQDEHDEVRRERRSRARAGGTPGRARTRHARVHDLSRSCPSAATSAEAFDERLLERSRLGHHERIAVHRDPEPRFGAIPGREAEESISVATVRAPRRRRRGACAPGIGAKTAGSGQRRSAREETTRGPVGEPDRTRTAPRPSPPASHAPAASWTGRGDEQRGTFACRPSRRRRREPALGIRSARRP